MLFNVKIVTSHGSRRRVCLVDVIAKCGVDAAEQAIRMALPALGLESAANLVSSWTPARGVAK